MRRAAVAAGVAAAALATGTASARAEEPAAPAGGHEIVAARTATSRTFGRADGSRVTQVAATAINFRNGSGDWVPIDTNLRSSGRVLQSTAAPVTVQLPQALGDGSPIRVQHGADVASLTPQGASPTQADVSGDQVIYANALGGADAAYDVQPTGVKETITVDSADGPSHYGYALNYSAGLSAHQLTDGAIALRHADGSVAFTIPAPTVQEHGGALTSAHVHETLSADGHSLDVVVDADWLSRAEFPVRIDPDIYDGNATDCDLANGASANTVNCGGSVSVGADGSPAVAHRAVLNFDMPGGDDAIPRDATVLSARLGLTQTALSGPGPVDVQAYGLTQSFSSQATWNSYDSTHVWSTAGGAYDSSKKLDSYHTDSSWTGEGLGWVFSSLAQSWVDTPSTNHGILLRSADESSPSKATFAGVDTTSTAPPLIEIAWSPRTGNAPGAKIVSQPLSDHLSVGVNVANGNLLTQGSEIDLPGVGQDVQLGSSYNQLQDGSAMGYGSLGYDSTLGFLDAKMYREGYNGHENLAWRGPDGAWYRFDRDSDNDQPGAAAWTQAPGLRAHVTTDQAEIAGTAILKFDQSGTKWYFHFGSDSNFSGFIGDLQKIVDRNGNTITVNYGPDDPHHATSLTDTNGRTVQLHYVPSSTSGGQAQLTSVTDASNRQWKWAYDPNTDLLQTYTDPDNNVTHYYWDAGAKLVKITTGGGRTTIIGYDPATDKISSVRRVLDGDKTSPTGGTDTGIGSGAHDSTWSFNYTPSGGDACPDPPASDPPVLGRTVVTDPNGHATTYCYDLQDRITDSFDALHHSAGTRYDSFSNVIRATSLAGTANASTSTFKFDNNENPMLDATPVKAGGDPDNPTAATSEINTAAYTGSEKYQPSSSTDPQGVTTSYGYDGSGNLTGVSDASSHNKATLHYPTTNNHGQPDYSEDGLSHRTNYGYRTTAPWDLLTVTPPTVSPLAIKPITFTYDNLSRVHTVSDGRGTTKTLIYDGEDRIKSVTLSGASTGSFGFVYDPDGNLTQRTDSANHTTTYVVDALNNRTEEDFPGAIVNKYTYDKLGNLASLTDATNQTTSYSYDPINRIKTISSPTRASGTGTDTITYTYTDRSGTSAPDTVLVDYPGGAKKTVKYDLAGKATSIVATDKNNANLINEALTYTTGTSSAPHQNAKVIQRTLDGLTTTYGYNGDVGRLATANTPGAASYAYSYDNAGNRTGKTTYTSTGSVADVVAFSYNADNELCYSIHSSTAANCGTTTSGTTSYTYDANGNQTAKGSATLSWDGFDRLTTGGFGYLSPTNGELTGSSAASYQNSTLGLIRQTTGSTVEALVRDPSGEVVAQRSGSDKQFYLDDQIGSTLGLVSDGGLQTRTLRYDPDGTATDTGTGPDAVVQWAGGHPVGGYYHFGARYYDVGTARWTQQDPLDQLTDLRQANRYSYAGGDPVNSLDPSGEGLFGDIVVGLGHVVTAYGCATVETGVGAGFCVAGLALQTAGDADAAHDIGERRGDD